MENPMENQSTRISVNDEIDKVITARYPISEQIAILRQKDTKPDEYKAFFDFAEQVKASVKASRADELTAAEDSGDSE